MDSDQHSVGVTVRQDAATVFQYADSLAYHRPSCGVAHAYDDSRTDEIQFGFKPGLTGRDLCFRRCHLNPLLASLFVAKMLHGTGQVQLLAVQSGLGKGAVEQLPGWSDKRLPLAVLVVARLLPDTDDPRIGRSRPEHRL